MADNKIGAYHLSDNPTLYEPARSNNFEFVVTGLGQLLRAGYSEEQTNAFLGNNVEELLRISVVKASVPTFTQEAITIRRGNSVMKAAGLPNFKDGSLIINDYLGADGKSILMAWQNLSYNVKTEKVGRMSQYKKDCYLLEYAPDYELVRTWTLKGCWISGLDMPDYDQEDGGRRQITATIQYDAAFMNMPDEEE